MLNKISEVHLQHIQLWYLVQHSLSAYHKLLQYFSSADAALRHLQQWSEVALHNNHLQRAHNFQTTESQQQWQHCLALIQQHTDFIVLEHEPDYPTQLLPYTDRPPILFGQGQLENLKQPQIAIVGSRKPSPHGRQVAYDFAYYLSEKGFYITSGLAEGIDAAAHQGGLAQQRTLAVIGTGLDQVYPSAHVTLRDQIVQQQGSIVTEFLPQTKALKQHFPRRNRIVSGLSLGVLVAEAKAESGSLITAQAAAAQGKITFAIPGHIYSEFHQGCHQLIREGAILVDHPEQILEDLALPTQWHMQAQQQQHAFDTSLIQPPKAQKYIANHVSTPPIESTDINIPEHLNTLYQSLDWVGQDLDQLAAKLDLAAAELTAALMELELLGLIQQHAGLYLRCRSTH